MPASGTGFHGPGKRLADASPGPWKDWRIRTRHGRAIRFIETYCSPSKGRGHGRPLRLARFQKEWLEEALHRDVDVAVLQTPRGNGKSSLGGALATWALFDDDETGSPQVPVVATTITQAIRSCYGVAVSMIRNEPELVGRSLIYTGISQPRVVVPFNEGELFPISNDTDGLQGLDPSLAIVDEMGFQPVESWDSLRLASGKRERSLVLGLGTPGLTRENAMFHLRRAAVEQRLPGVVYHEHSAPDGCALGDRRAWRQANPAIRAGFLRESALATDLGITPEAHFRIFRLGQWYDAGLESWLGDDARSAWEALTSPWDLVDGAPTWVGVDIGYRHDSSAVVVLQEREDGRHHAACRLWVPTPDRPVDVSDVARYIRELDARYDVQVVAFDPRYFDLYAKQLSDEGIQMTEVPQTLPRMTQAVGGLYDAIVKGRLTHDGQEDFMEQVVNAAARFNDNGFTLSKGKSKHLIDASIALALAHAQAVRHEPAAAPMWSFG